MEGRDSLGRFIKGFTPHHKDKKQPFKERPGRRIKLDEGLVINQYLNENKGIKELGNLHSCSPSTIKNLLKRNGIEIRPWSFYKEDIILKCKRKAIDDYQTGRRSPWCKGLKGVEFRKHYKKKIGPKFGYNCSKKLNLDDERIVQLYTRENFSIRKIAKMFNCNPNTIQYRLNERNIKIRPTGFYSKRRFKNGEMDALIKARETTILPLKDSKIEIRIQNFLKELGINFYTHQYIKNIKYSYQCDILIPKQEGFDQITIIECDGDYWHANPETQDLRKLKREIKANRCKDYERTFQMKEKGYKVIRLWGNNINKMELNDFEEVLAC